MTGRRPKSRGDDFVFDTAVLFDSEESALVDAPGIDTHFLRFGMEVHAGDRTSNKDSKTEVLYVSIRSTTNQPSNLREIKLGDTNFFPIIDSFCYLGNRVSK